MARLIGLLLVLGLLGAGLVLTRGRRSGQAPVRVRCRIRVLPVVLGIVALSAAGGLALWLGRVP